MDKELPPECIEAWNAMLRDDVEEQAKLSASERLQMLFTLLELGRLVPEHPAYTRWREKEEQEVRARWNRLKDILGQDRGPSAG